jgi:hypothetical protein
MLSAGLAGSGSLSEILSGAQADADKTAVMHNNQSSRQKKLFFTA